MTLPLKLYTGNELLNHIHPSAIFRQRHQVKDLMAYLAGNSPRVCVLYGLRRTGKTIMMHHAIQNLAEAEQARCALIRCDKANDVLQLDTVITELRDKGYKYVFVDEVTYLEDFISIAGRYSDMFAGEDFRIVLTGTDSLGFYFMHTSSLYDRDVTIHTSYTSFEEYKYLHPSETVDDYIRHGALQSISLLKDDKACSDYIGTAIVQNIQHSLEHYDEGEHFNSLRNLYGNYQLTEAIQRVINDLHHAFVLRTFVRAFKQQDLSAGKHIARQRSLQDPSYRVFEKLDYEAIHSCLEKTLGFLPDGAPRLPYTPAEIAEIRRYLEVLELVTSVQVVFADGDTSELCLLTHPGIKYQQTLAVYHSLMKDSSFLGLSSRDRTLFIEILEQNVLGHLLEEVVLLNCKYALADTSMEVFQLRFSDQFDGAGEFDMVIYDKDLDASVIFEIKHSDKAVPEQTSHICNPAKLAYTRTCFGSIRKQCVLYNGPDLEVGDIQYLNVTNFLQHPMSSIDALFSRAQAQQTNRFL